MKSLLKKYGGFTLLEMLVVTIVIGIIFPVMVEIYSFMIKSNKEIVARENAIQQGYEFFEKLNILMQDYTIDYEEYYNRQMVGCVDSGQLLTGSDFQWNVGISGYCTQFTAYGNENSTQRIVTSGGQIISGSYHDIYNCSSVEEKNRNGLPRTIRYLCGKFGSKQSFGQYKSLFIDVNRTQDSDDDEDLGQMVRTHINAIQDPNNVQELYLISNDGKSRLFFRRKLVSLGNTGFAQYRIQMLRLRGFDAGQDHNFDSNNIEGLYDGQMDTRACDTSMGFIGNGSGVGGAYSGYYLPKDEEDCWIDITYGSTSVYTWNIVISPLGDPDLFWIDDTRQINPYIKILLVNSVYFPGFYNDLSTSSSITDFKVPIQTTINMKSFYQE